MSEVANKIIQVTADVLHLPESQITNDASFTDDLGADSLDLVELMMGFEAAFGCDIPDDDASKISTIQDAIDYINKRKESEDL